MIAKRFNSYCDNENIRIRIDDDIKNKEVFHIYFAELDDALYCKSKLNPILDLLNQLSDENEQLKKGISLFKGKDAGHYQRWVNQIKKYLDESNPDFEYDEDFIIKIALSYTLQSLRNGESLKRFQWEYKELKE